MNTKILIGMGTCDKFGYCEKEVINSILQQSHSDYDFLIVDNSKDIMYSTNLRMKYPEALVVHLERPRYFRDAVGQARQFILNHAVFNFYDYLFFVDADFLLNKDNLTNLLSHKKDFVTGVIGYPNNLKDQTTVCIKSNKPTKVLNLSGLPPVRPILLTELDKLPNLKEITCCGLSCCLISHRALLNMNFYVDHGQQAFLEDFVFCRDLNRKGISLFLDKNVLPEHLHKFMPERYLRNKNSV